MDSLKIDSQSRIMRETLEIRNSFFFFFRLAEYQTDKKRLIFEKSRFRDICICFFRLLGNVSEKKNGHIQESNRLINIEQNMFFF